MKKRHIVAIISSIICTLASVALVISIAILFFEFWSSDLSYLETEGALPGVGLIGLLAMSQITVSLIVIGAVNALMSVFLAASIIRKYSKKIDSLGFSLIGINGIMSLFFIVSLIIAL